MRTPRGVEDEGEDVVKRRIQGFGLGFEKIFATTSIKLPVSAYSVFTELHCASHDQVYSRVFNGQATVLDLKKWIYEKLWVQMNAYDLSYAEPSKTTLTDQLRLLTMEDSVDTRTLATARAAQGQYTGVPGVHRIGDVGVTRLYIRLKCRTCGDLLNGLQNCRKFKSFGDIEVKPEVEEIDPFHTVGTTPRGPACGLANAAFEMLEDSRALARIEDPGSDGEPRSEPRRRLTLPNKKVQVELTHNPTREEPWYRPDERKNCLYNTRGYEMYEAARLRGAAGHSEFARIYISCGKEPSKLLKLAENFPAQGRTKVISY